MNKIKLPISVSILILLVGSSGCGMKQLRLENDQLHEEVNRLQQVERDYGDKLNEVEQLSEEERDSIRSEMQEMRERLTASLEDQINRSNALIQKVKDLTVIEIGEAALFPSGQADLTQEGTRLIRQMTDVFQGYQGYHLRIEGHTDSVPIGESLKSRFESNWELSTARATTVIRYMIYGLEVEANRLSAVGYARYRPVASNDTDEGRAKNRRIRIVVFKMVNEERSGSE